MLFAIGEGAVRLFVKSAPPEKPALEFINADFGSGFPIERDELLFWKIKPSGEIPNTKEKMNSAGMRGGEYPAPFSQPDILNLPKNILCLGDSNTFGIGVGADATFAARLDRWLNWPRGRAKVYNCGTPGYSIYQMWKTLQLRWESTRPGLVILYAGAWNDYMPAMGADDETLARKAETWNRLRSISGLRNLTIYRYFETLTNGSSAASGPSRSREDVSRAFFTKHERPDGPRIPPESFRKILNLMIDWTSARGGDFILVTPPLPAATRANVRDGEEYVKIIEQVAASRSAGGRVAIARAREALTKSKEEDKIYFFDGVHPNATGHAIITNEIIRAMGELAAARALIDGRPAPFLQKQDDPRAGIVSLKKLFPGAKLYLNGSGAPVSAASANGDDPNLIVVPAPSKILFENITIPPAASLVFERACRPSGGADVKETTIRWKVTIQSDGVEAVLFNSEDLYKSADWTPPVRERIDLGVYERKNVNIQLETAGEAFRVHFGRGEIIPFQ